MKKLNLKFAHRKLCLLFYFCTFLSILLSFVGCTKKFGVKNLSHKDKSPVQKVDNFVEVKVDKVLLGDIQEILETTGSIDANTSVKVSSKMPGRVIKIYCDKGDKVTKGQLLLKIDDKDLLAQETQTKSALKVAEAARDRVKIGARDQEIEQAKQGLTQAESNLKNVEKNLARMKSLFNDGIIAKQALDEVETGQEVAKSTYEMAKERLSLVKEGATKEDKRAVEAQVEQAHAGLAFVKSQLAETEIRAPISGEIGAKFIEIGEMAAPGIPLFIIFDINKVKAKASISDKEVNKIKKGAGAEIKIDAYPNKEFWGRVIFISPVANPINKMFDIEAEVLNIGKLLKAGMFAHIKWSVSTHENVLQAPEKAVIERTGKKVIFIVKNDIAYQRDVKTGLSDGEFVEIIRGASEGESIVVEGNYELEDRTKVKVRR